MNNVDTMQSGITLLFIIYKETKPDVMHLATEASSQRNRQELGIPERSDNNVYAILIFSDTASFFCIYEETKLGVMHP